MTSNSKKETDEECSISQCCSKEYKEFYENYIKINSELKVIINSVRDFLLRCPK